MDFRRMGGSELEVSAVGGGSRELGGTNYGPIDEAKAVAAIHRRSDAPGRSGAPRRCTRPGGPGADIWSNDGRIPALRNRVGGEQ